MIDDIPAPAAAPPAADPAPLIAARGVSKSFDGVPAVRDLSLDIPAGAIFGFIGPSGCGKTTTVRLLLGIYHPDDGEISVLGREPARFRRREREDIGYMPQQFVLYPELSAWENLNFAASIYGVPLRRAARLNELLALVELDGHAHKKVRDLSGGMQRRLGLAAAIIHNPRLIFLDEPTAGIDPVLRHKFWEYFQTLKAQGHTLFITTQYVNEAAYCDYVGVMAGGRLLLVAPPDELRRRVLGGELLRLEAGRLPDEAELAALREQPFVRDGRAERLAGRTLQLVVDDAAAALPQLLAWCEARGLPVSAASPHVPLFDDLFVQLIEQETAAAEATPEGT